MSQTLISALQTATIYPHPVNEIQLIETHISWVLLTGDFVYKVKKPVNFGFLDFTDLAARKHFCEEELRLNQRMTDSIYLEVVPITGSESAPEINGNGPVIEYALKMTQFANDNLFTQLQERGELSETLIDETADLLACFHAETPRVTAYHPLGTPESVMAPVRDNFVHIRNFLTEQSDLIQLQALDDWAESTYERLYPQLQARKQDGFIRECHGDLHLGNITLINGKVTVFDCIEFNEPFRMIDVTADIAFMVMDLEDHGCKSLANRFFNRWLEKTGDYGAVPLLNFYKSYRALVRAKVSLLRLSQEQDATQREQILQKYRSYADLAESYTAIPARFLCITHGFSASGKSHAAIKVAEAVGALRIRSDVERKRMLGEQAESQLNAGIYSSSATEQTYQRLHQLAHDLLLQGYPVVLDATYLKHEQRRAAANVAEETGVPFLIIDCQAPDEVLLARMAKRREAGQDPSDATQEVLQAQKAHYDPLTEQECQHTQVVDTLNDASLEQLAARLQLLMPQLATGA